jgi:hypothetical protein
LTRDLLIERQMIKRCCWHKRQSIFWGGAVVHALPAGVQRDTSQTLLFEFELGLARGAITSQAFKFASEYCPCF